MDVGCGNKPRGDVNLDISVPLRIPENFVLGDAHTLPFRNKGFSLIYSNSVIEHLINPDKALREFKRVSTKLCLITPDCSNLDRTLDHLYSWNIHTLTNLLKRHYSKISVYSSIGFTSPAPMFQGRLKKYLPFLNLFASKLGFSTTLFAICKNL